MHEALQPLVDAGWLIQFRPSSWSLSLPESFRERYPQLPEAYLQIFGDLQSCESPDEKLWLLCPTDYAELTDSAFAWNEFERISLEAAAGDEEWTEQIRAFWSQHLPFCMSVRDGYAYAAFRMNPDGEMQIVIGREPEFEEVEVFPGDLKDFLQQLPHTRTF